MAWLKPYARAFTALLFFLSACATTAYSQVSFDLRTVHIIDGAGPLDVHFDNRQQPSFKNVQYEYTSALSPSLLDQDGMINIKLVAAGAGLGSSIVEQDLSIASGFEYTVVGYGTNESAKLKALQRSKTLFPGAGKTLLRIFNATTLGTGLDFHLKQVGTPQFMDVKRDNVTNFANVDAEAATLFITETGSTTPITQALAPLGTDPYITIIITGSSKSNLVIYVLKDFNKVSAQLLKLDEAQANFTNIRVVHALPQKSLSAADSSLDIYLSDALKTSKLKYRYASNDYGPLNADSMVVKFVPGGESPSTTVLTVARQFRKDTSHVVIITKFKGGAPTPITMKRSPILPTGSDIGKTKARFANATDFYGPLTVVLRDGNGDTVRFENIAFGTYTPFREISNAGQLSVEVFRQGSTSPFYTGNTLTPSNSSLSCIALGDDVKFSIDMLNESFPGVSPLQTFDPVSDAPTDVGLTGAVYVWNAPNPFAEQTEIHYSVPNPGIVHIDLYNILGARVATLLTEHREAGAYTLPFSSGTLTPGTYTGVVRTEQEKMATWSIHVIR